MAAQANSSGTTTSTADSAASPPELVAACGLADAKQAVAEARLLFEKGTDIGVADATGATALHIACARGHVRLAVLLIQRGANVNAQDNSGRTPLHEAAEIGCVPLVHILLGSQADTDLADAQGTLPWQVACVEGDQSVVEVLMNAGMPDGGEVVLHVYRLGNDRTLARVHSALRLLGGGLWHTAIEVRYLSNGFEWSYGHTFEGTGLFAMAAGENGDHHYSHEVSLGRTEMDQADAHHLLERLKIKWPGSEYDIVSHNCQIFCAALSAALGTQSLPSHIRRTAGVARFALKLSKKMSGKEPFQQLEQNPVTRGARWEQRQKQKRGCGEIFLLCAARSAATNQRRNRIMPSTAWGGSATNGWGTGWRGSEWGDTSRMTRTSWIGRMTTRTPTVRASATQHASELGGESACSSKRPSMSTDSSFNSGNRVRFNNNTQDGATTPDGSSHN